MPVPNPTMTVELRWSTDGRSSWCVVEDGVPYCFDSEPACRRVVDHYPSGIRRMCTPSPQYSLLHDPSQVPPEMYAEQRWRDDGTAMWCVIWRGEPYAFGSDVSREQIEGVMLRHPDGMRGFGSDTALRHRTPPPPRRSTWGSVPSWAAFGVDTSTGADYSAIETRVMAQQPVERIRLEMESPIFDEWLTTYPGATYPGATSGRISTKKKSTPTPPPALPPVPPCKRCGAEIYVSPYFTKGKPCPCLGGR